MDKNPDPAFSHNPDIRIAEALEVALEALRLARREVSGAATEPARWRWVAVGLVSALQAALIAALSGYASARSEDVANPSQPARLAPVALLLRRARSADYLNPPERLELRGSDARGLEALVALRNAAVHGLGGQAEADPRAPAQAAARVLAHLLLRHRAFDASRYGLLLTLIDQELTALGKDLKPGDTE